jgi:hypothetical protein
MLPLDVGSATGDARAASAPMPPGLMPDMVLADAIAHAIGAVPGVAGLGQGLFAKAATYGPGKHIAGVVLQHLAPGELSVEIHVVLDEAGISTGPNQSTHIAAFYRVDTKHRFSNAGASRPVSAKCRQCHD